MLQLQYRPIKDFRLSSPLSNNNYAGTALLVAPTPVRERSGDDVALSEKIPKKCVTFVAQGCRQQVRVRTEKRSR